MPDWSPTLPDQYTSFVGTELHQLRPDGSSYEFLGYINRADCDRIVRLLNQVSEPPAPGHAPLSYSDGLRAVRGLMDDGSNTEYVRGQVELLIDLFGMSMEEKGKVCGDLGLPPNAASACSPPPSRYKTSNVSLDEGIELIVEAAMSLVSVGTDGRCKTLRDFYTLMGTEEALRSLLGGDEKDAHDVIVDRFIDAAQSPEEKSAIDEGRLSRPLGLTLHYEHREAIRSVLINWAKRDTGLISEILAAAETGV